MICPALKKKVFTYTLVKVTAGQEKMCKSFLCVNV